MAGQLVQRVEAFHEGPIQARSLGVLPWCRLPSGEAAIVLGREACQMSLRWAPFEGSAKLGETTEEGAAREWVEESLGLIKFSEDPGPNRYVDTAWAAEALKRGAFSHAVHLRFRLRMRSQAWKEASTLVAQVVYDPDLERRFELLRLHLIELSRFSTSLHRLRQRVDHPNALYGRSVAVDRHPLRVVDVLGVSGFRRRADGLIDFEACVSCDDPATTGVCRYVKLRLSLSYSTTVYTVIYFVYMSVLRKLAATRQGALAPLTDHPAVRFLRDAHGNVAGVRVNADFLEKERVKYWTRDELAEMMREHGHLNGAIFRSSSCALMEVALDKWDEWFA
jgi:hypothetical protein